MDSMEVGGAETIVAQLCQWQRERGHEAIVLAHLRLGALGERMLSQGFRVQVLGPAHLPQIAYRFLRALHTFKPDVVHCHNPTPTIYAAVPARLAGAQSVISTRHSLVEPPYSLPQESKYAIASRCCDHIVGICEATCNNLRNAPMARRTRIVRIYNGTAAISQPSAGRSQNGATVFLYVGRLAPVKDHATLLQAFQHALQSNNSLHLQLVGDGPCMARLRNLAQELGISSKVHFAGQQIDIAPFLAAADTFIMSSVSEGVPMSLLQAMSVGLPAIVTDVGGMAEVVRLANSGLIVPVSNPAKMADAMLAIAEDRNQRLRYSTAALAAFERWFTLDRMAESYMDLYRHVASFA